MGNKYANNSPSVESIPNGSSTTYDTVANNAISSSNVIKVIADNVITTNDRQFISIEEKNQLRSMLDAITSTSKHVMYREMYDRDADGLVDVAKKALTADVVLWENIIDKPDITVPEIEESVDNTHIHNNLEILDNISVDNDGNLSYKGQSIKLPDTLMHKYDYDVDNDGLIDHALYADSTNWENILNKPLFYTPSQHTHKITDITGNINATTFGNLPLDSFLTVNSKISINQIKNLDSLAVTIPEVDGGDASAKFDEDDNYTRILIRKDRSETLNIINPVLADGEMAFEEETHRYKIGNGILTWRSLPFEYNTPSAVRFNTFSKSFTDKYVPDVGKVTSVESIATTLSNPSSIIMYSGAVRGNDNNFYAIPYNSNDVFYCLEDGSGQSTITSTFNNTGAGWYGGVAYDNFIYCTPYNANYILRINTRDKTLAEVCVGDSTIATGKTAKFMNGTIADNGLIFFAPHNSAYVLVLDPSNNTLSTIASSAWSNKENAGNCCNIVNNPVDGMLYVMPKNCDSIVQIDPVLKTTRVVATITDGGMDKFSTAVLAPNGLIYCIPSYGYDKFVVFDPNTYDIEYLTIVGFNTSTYDVYNEAVVAPNNKMYLIPSGTNSNTIWEFNISNNTLSSLANISDVSDRWCGGKLNKDGKIICLPYKATRLLALNTKTDTQIPSSDLTRYFNK